MPTFHSLRFPGLPVAPLCLLFGLGCAELFQRSPDAKADSTAVARAGAVVSTSTCADPALAEAPKTPIRPACDNDRLTPYDGLLVLAPHPDDEVLAFAGLIDAYLRQGKPVKVVVATDGDAYCDACRFWKTGEVEGEMCDAEDLSNFATPEVDSFAEVRRGESRAAMAVLGGPEPIFLGYPDTGLAASWANAEAGKINQPLRRSDFGPSEACDTGYALGPETALTAETLAASLVGLISGTSGNTLIATTHWLDGHGDHAGLGSFVRRLNGELESPRSVAYGVIHANTPKDTPHFDCWYPAPGAIACPCFEQDCASANPEWLTALRLHRYRPDWPARLPDDANYGDESQLCLPESVWKGEGATKLAAVNSYGSQLGFAKRDGEIEPALGGLMDCNGYLISFVRATEAFVLIDASQAASLVPETRIG